MTVQHLLLNFIRTRILLDALRRLPSRQARLVKVKSFSTFDLAQTIYWDGLTQRVPTPRLHCPLGHQNPNFPFHTPRSTRLMISVIQSLQRLQKLPSRLSRSSSIRDLIYSFIIPRDETYTVLCGSDRPHPQIISIAKPNLRIVWTSETIQHEFLEQHCAINNFRITLPTDHTITQRLSQD